MKCIFSVDVEDWFHILDVPSAPALPQWDALPSRVEANFLRLLDLFSEAGVRTTCFFLGWVAQKFPHLVKEADKRGHEIASHGYGHRVLREMSSLEFYQDALTAKTILEDLCGRPVSGYRAPGFSVTKEIPWFFAGLVEAGYRYDTSVFPGRCESGGLRNGFYAPYLVLSRSGAIVEFPITVARLCGKAVCLFGGGHLRLAPWFLIQGTMRKVLREDRPVVCYIHPREIDPDHPRLPMSLRRRFKSYVNLKTTEQKIQRLLAEFEFTSFQEYISEHLSQVPFVSEKITISLTPRVSAGVRD